MSRILVVDDDPDIRALLAAFLRAEGHMTEFAEDGVRGVEVASRIAPDLVLTDFQMPRMDGFGLFNAVRAWPQTAKVPVVMLTAHNSQSLMLKALALGLDDFIGKPVSREELNKVIGPLLRMSASLGPRAKPPTKTLAASRAEFFGSVVCCEIHRLEAFMMKLKKAELVELLEQFASGVAEVIRDDGGWMVKPDAHHVMVGFTEEPSVKDHALRALRCALKVVLAAQRLKPWIARRFDGRDLPDFVVAIGVHTGTIQARPPRAGSTDPGLKGEAVECAMLLAESNMSLHWSVAASQTTAQAAGFAFLAGRNAKVEGPDGKEMGAIEVKGFAPPPPPAPPLAAPAKPVPAKAAPVAAKAAPKAAPAPAAAVAPVAAPPPAPAPVPSAVQERAAALIEAAVERNDKLVVAVAAIPKAAPPVTPAAPPKAAARPAPKPAAKPAGKPAGKPARADAQPVFAPPPKEVPLPPPVDPFEGRTVVIKLADDGIVTVHLTLRAASGSQEVLKGFLINEDKGDKKQVKRRTLHKFVEQYATFRSIEHANIARTTDHGLSATHLFVAQEYCAGGDLRNLIAQGMSPDDALKVLLRVANALKAAHGRGFVHGDLRPANVMIREDGSFAVVDFALARVVEYAVAEGESGVLLRSPDYLAPEMINGQAADVRSDIYALGLLLHEMLTGKRAYASPDLSKVMMDQLNAPVPTLPSPHEKFQPLLDRLMAKDVARRFASVGDLIAFMGEAKLHA